MNQTIYFRKEVWEKFENEDSKSQLVNELLAKHYGTLETTPPKALLTDEATLTGFRNVPDGTRIKDLASVKRFEQGVCKIHGLPLDGRGRCMQKGCKYS